MERTAATAWLAPLVLIAAGTAFLAGSVLFFVNMARDGLVFTCLGATGLFCGLALARATSRPGPDPPAEDSDAAAVPREI